MSAMVAGPWAGLRAVLLLARGRADGVLPLAAGDAAGQRALARQSFAAVLLCLPIFLAVQELGRATHGMAMLRELASFLLGWLGYAVLSQGLASAAGRGALWPRFVVLWNWCNLVQYLLMAAALVPQLAGAPPVLAQTAWLVAMGWALWLQWAATRIGLDLPAGRAALLVVADMALGLVVQRLVTG